MAKSRNLKSWELLVLAIILFVGGQYGIKGVSGAFVAIVGQLLFLFSIVAFVRERIAHRKSKK